MYFTTWEILTLKPPSYGSPAQILLCPSHLPPRSHYPSCTGVRLCSQERHNGRPNNELVVAKGNPLHAPAAFTASVHYHSWSVYQELLDTAPTTRARALAISTALPHAGDWLNGIPSPALGLYMQDRELSALLARPQLSPPLPCMSPPC